MFIRIRNDNGYDLCPTCAHCESELCMFCDEGDQYEEGDTDFALNDKGKQPMNIRQRTAA